MCLACRMAAIPIDSPYRGTVLTRGIEQGGVGATGRGSEPRLMRGGDQRRARLIEADVTVRAKSENQQIESASASDLPLVAEAFRLRVGGGAIQKVNLARRQVDVIEQVTLHERAIAARIGRREPDEFVEVEGRGPAEVHGSGVEQRTEFRVESNGRAAGGQPEDQPRIGRHAPGDVARQRTCGAGRRCEPADRQSIYVHRQQRLWDQLPHA